MKTSSLTIAFVALATFVCVGCSSKPSLSAGEQALRSRIETESEGRLKLAKFKKTGDEAGGGLDSYCWAFEGELEVLQDCVWLFDSVTGTLPVDFRTAGGGEQAEGRALQRGQRYSLIGAVYIDKEGKGWKAGHIAMRKIPREIR